MTNQCLVRSACRLLEVTILIGLDASTSIDEEFLKNVQEKSIIEGLYFKLKGGSFRWQWFLFKKDLKLNIYFRHIVFMTKQNE